MNAAHRLVSQGHRYSPFYGGYLANHLPMSVLALDRLGASEEQIAAFAARYARKLEPLPRAADAISDANAAAFLGRRGAVGSWAAYFEAEVSRAGAQETLRRWLDRLMPGVGSTAFHGVIRAGYALESGDARELAHALAAWAADFTPLGALPEFSGTATPAEAFAALKADPRFSSRRPGSNIAERMAAAAADPAAVSALAAVDPRALDVRSQARALLGAYAASGDFTVLHGVTACLGFRLLLPFAADRAAARGFLWQALACAYLSTFGRPESVLRGDEGLSWPQIRARAAAAQDEHDVKLAYVCWREWRDAGDDLYRRAASATLAPR